MDGKTGREPRFSHTLCAMKRLVLQSLALLAAWVAPTAAANVLYKCTNASGVVLYTNQKSADRKCEVLSRTPAVPPAPTSAAAPGRPKATQPSPADFPKVSSNEQKARDGDRRAILDRELANETTHLEKARRELAAAASQPAASQSPDTQRTLRDTVTLHERNIEALKKEIGNLR